MNHDKLSTKTYDLAKGILVSFIIDMKNKTLRLLIAV